LNAEDCGDHVYYAAAVREGGLDGDALLGGLSDRGVDAGFIGIKEVNEVPAFERVFAFH